MTNTLGGEQIAALRFAHQLLLSPEKLRFALYHQSRKVKKIRLKLAGLMPSKPERQMEGQKWVRCEGPIGASPLHNLTEEILKSEPSSSGILTPPNPGNTNNPPPPCRKASVVAAMSPTPAMAASGAIAGDSFEPVPVQRLGVINGVPVYVEKPTIPKPSKRNRVDEGASKDKMSCFKYQQHHKSQNILKFARRFRRTPKKLRRLRTKIEPDMLQILEERYDKCHFVSHAEREELAEQLSITERAVVYWFQNRRRRDIKNLNNKRSRIDNT